MSPKGRSTCEVTLQKKTKRTKPKSDQAPGSNHHFNGNEGDNGTCQITPQACSQQNPDCGNCYRIKDLVSSKAK